MIRLTVQIMSTLFCKSFPLPSAPAVSYKWSLSALLSFVSCLIIILICIKNRSLFDLCINISNKVILVFSCTAFCVFIVFICSLCSTAIVRSPVLWTVDLMFYACFFFLFFSQLTFSDVCKPTFSKLFHMTWLYSKKKRCYADFVKVPPNKNEGWKTPNFAQSRV